MLTVCFIVLFKIMTTKKFPLDGVNGNNFFFQQVTDFCLLIGSGIYVILKVNVHKL